MNSEPFGSDITKTRGNTWLLLLLVCAGSFLRVYNFWVPPLWIDEYGTWWVVAGSNWADVAARAVKIQGQSPFYYLIVRFFTDLAGYSPFVLRLTSILFGIGTLAVVYPLAMRIFRNRHIAFVSLVVFGLSDRLIWYSQNARPYSLALFLTLLSFWFFLCLLHTERTVYRVGYILTTTLLVYAHYLFGFVVIIQLVYLLWVSGWAQLKSKTWILTILLIALLVLPTTAQLIDLFGRRHTLNWMSSFQSMHLISLVIDFLYGAFFAVILIPTVLVAIFLGFKWEEQYKPDTRAKLTLPVIWVLTPFLSFIILPKLFGIMLFAPRYTLFAYPAIFFLMAWFMSNLRATGWKKWLPPVLFAALTLTYTTVPAAKQSGAFTFWYPYNWKNAANVLASSYQPGDVIVLRTAFIEADQLAVSQLDEETVSYLNWPILAHLPTSPKFNIVALPSRSNETTNEYLRSLHQTASNHHRVWIVGEGRLTTSFRNTFTSQSGYQVAQHSAHGKVDVTLLQKNRR